MANSTMVCLWTKENGEKCKNTNLVKGSHFCYTHYWQALWVKHQFDNIPRPQKADWKLISQGIFSVFLSIVFMYFMDLLTIGQFLESVNYLLSLPISQWNVFYALDTLRLFLAGTFLFIGWIVYFTFNPIIPMTPRIRYVVISISTIVLVFVAYAFSALVIYLLYIKQDISLQANRINILLSIAAVLLPLISTNLLIVYLAASKPSVLKNPKSFRVYRLLELLTFGLSLVGIYSAWYFSEKQVVLSLIAILVGVYNIHINMQYMLLGITLIGYEYWLIIVAGIADAIQPLPDGYFGDIISSPKDRQSALQTALTEYAKLTPLEQKELDYYVISKQPLPLWQRIMAVVWIILSAFLIEAPASFLWQNLCIYLSWGKPFCP